MDLTVEIDREIKKVKLITKITMIFLPFLLSANSIGNLILTEDEISFLTNEAAQMEYQMAYQMEALKNPSATVERKYPQNNIKRRYIQIRDNNIIPTLKKMGMYTPELANLLMVTVHAETKGLYNESLANDGAYGITQMQASTFKDMFDHYFNYFPTKRAEVLKLMSQAAGENPQYDELFNANVSVAMSAHYYERFKHGIKKGKATILHMCHAWKTKYNTHLGAGTLKGCMNGFPQEILL